MARAVAPAVVLQLRVLQYYIVSYLQAQPDGCVCMHHAPCTLHLQGN